MKEELEKEHKVTKIVVQSSVNVSAVSKSDYIKGIKDDSFSSKFDRDLPTKIKSQ